MEALWKVEEIKTLKARYFRLLDTKQWAQWGELFTEDATLLVEAGVNTWGGEPGAMKAFNGREEITNGVRALHHSSLTVHHGHMPEIELTSPVSARGVWAMEDIVEYHTANYSTLIRGHGHYHEIYKFLDGQWHFASVQLTRLRLEVVTRTKSPITRPEA